MNIAKIVGLSLLGLFGLFVVSIALVLFSHINTIPKLQTNAEAGWGQVENVYQRRSDLIPNLVEVVKGYAGHENTTLREVIEARAKATQMVVPKDLINNPAAAKQMLAAQDTLGQALGRLMVVSEKYPDLKANKNFLELQSQIEGTENRIAVERRAYVKTVQEYNLEVRTLPGSLFARFIYDAKPMEQFSAETGAKTAPKVSFSK